jgi:hypothetical protein
MIPDLGNGGGTRGYITLNYVSAGVAS